jgi:DeoR/GlpR family transcriptional regulator of sugar metabolism
MDPDAGEVFALERQQHIARLVEEHGRARVADLAARFGVSTVTIRKDLLALEGEGRVVRAHGGALAVERQHAESAFDVRERIRRDEKEQIAEIAASMVTTGESIALDASTTALAMARHLKQRGPWPHLTVTTNGLRIATELAGFPGITVAMPGGIVRWEAMSVVGPLGDGAFRRMNISKAFMGAAGFTIAAGLTDATEEEAQIKRLMASAAQDVIAIIDHTKWGRAAFATFARTDELTAVITDGSAPAAMIEQLADRGVEVRQPAGRSRAGEQAPRPR